MARWLEGFGMLEPSFRIFRHWALLSGGVKSNVLRYVDGMTNDGIHRPEKMRSWSYSMTLHFLGQCFLYIFYIIGYGSTSGYRRESSQQRRVFGKWELWEVKLGRPRNDQELTLSVLHYWRATKCVCAMQKRQGLSKVQGCQVKLASLDTPDLQSSRGKVAKDELIQCTFCMNHQRCLKKIKSQPTKHGLWEPLAGLWWWKIRREKEVLGATKTSPKGRLPQDTKETLFGTPWGKCRTWQNSKTPRWPSNIPVTQPQYYIFWLFFEFSFHFRMKQIECLLRTYSGPCIYVA